MTTRFIVTMLFLIGMFLITILGIIWWNGFYCHQRWVDFDNRWSLFAGCQVKIDGRWVPDERVRQF